MWQFTGQWFAAGSSLKQSATLEVSEQGRYRVIDANQDVLNQGLYAHLGQQDQIPGVPLRLISSQGQLAIAVEQAATFNAMHQRLQGQPSWSTRLTGVESSLRLVLLFTLVGLALAALFFVRGVPAIANGLADRVPDVAVQQLGSEVERVLDWRQMQPTTLTDDEQAYWHQQFQVALDLEPDTLWRVEFRHSPDLGANALALPHGAMIFTDDLLRLAESPDEVIGVLLHEMGHVMHRHGLRQVIQSSLWTLSFAMLTGDVGSTAEWLAAAPILFAALSYSRRFEFEADAYAARRMRELGKDPAALGHLLQRMGCDGEQECDSGWQYLQTHPATEERVRRLLD